MGQQETVDRGGNILNCPSAALLVGPVLNKTDPGAVWGEMNRARLKSADFGEPCDPGSGSFSTFGPSFQLVSSTSPPLTLNQPRTEVCSAAAVLIRTPPHTLSTTCPAGLVLHEVLVEVDAEQGADDLAGSHPPREEGEETSEEDGSEDGAQSGEGLRQVGDSGLDVLLHVLHAVFIVVEAAVGHGSCGGYHQGWGHAGGLVHAASPGEIAYKVSRLIHTEVDCEETTEAKSRLVYLMLRVGFD